MAEVIVALLKKGKTSPLHWGGWPSYLFLGGRERYLGSETSLPIAGALGPL
jgi:hypothetical protein